ncbi:MAG: SGNH/GDSL hydrolase family protein, partial [Proteobacteria bacterium]|nr:SGNH/GDSL hydrolase family protein [Pseudomonadota bacterium]
GKWGRILALFILVGASLAVALGLSELLVTWVRPQVVRYPKFRFSPAYHHEWFPGTTVEHYLPGHWRFSYIINEYGYRGPAVPLSNEYPVPNIVVLGDSFTAGFGVDEGRVYTDVLRESLGGAYEVVNLGVGGWGLTQEIRRFYEFGILYRPATVVLQFCYNDPRDNEESPVCKVSDGGFLFPDMKHSIGPFRQRLSGSILQKSQLKSLVSASLYNLRQKKKEQEISPGQARERDQAREEAYNELLEVFARDLKRRGIPLVMISVNGDLDSLPEIRKAIARLEGEGHLTYLETADWFAGVTDYGTPEGHAWGEKAHRILGEHLADHVRRIPASSGP